jgi:HNH endonuclease
MPRKGQFIKGQWSKCEQCGKKMWVQNCRIRKWKKARFCGNECRNKGMSKAYHLREKILDMYNKEMLSVTQIDKRLGIRARSSVEGVIKAAGFKIRPMAFYMQFGRNPNYKGGSITKEGYKRLGHTMEHRIVMEKVLGRKLSSNEHVHHLNGVKTDNRPENLSLLTQKPHGEFHAKPFNNWKKMYQSRIDDLERQLELCTCRRDKRSTGDKGNNRRK